MERCFLPVYKFGNPYGPVYPNLAEEVALKAIKCGFKSHDGHVKVLKKGKCRYCIIGVHSEHQPIDAHVIGPGELEYRRCDCEQCN